MLVNLDSEEDGRLTVGCAGSTDTWIRDRPARARCSATARSRSAVTVSGGLGGHSGTQHRARSLERRQGASGARSARRTTTVPFRLVSLDGGKSRNAIPRDAIAVVLGRRRRRTRFRDAVAAAAATIRDEYAKTDAGVTVDGRAAADARRRLDGRGRRRSCSTPSRSCPTGPLALSPDFDGLVETSTSLGEAITEGDKLTLHSLSRSSNDSALPEVIAALDAVGAARRRRARGEAQLRRLAPRPRLARRSPPRAASTSALFGEPPIVTAVHAGLETAVIGDKVAGARHALVRPADRVPALARRAREHPHGRALLEAARRLRRRAVEAGK